MDWTCTLTEERLSDYLEGQLSAADSAAIEMHKRSCVRCSELVAQVGGLLSEMHSLDFVEEPPTLQAKILEASLGPRPSKQGWRRWFAWTPMIWQPRFAIGMATVAACAVIIVQAGGVVPTKLHKANLNPAAVFRSVNRQAHLTYAQGVKFVNGLRVVYEIESRLQPQNPPQENPAPPERNDLRPNQKNPEEKSDQRPGRSQARSDVFFAQAESFGAGTPARAGRFSFSATHTQPTSETHRGRNCGRHGAGNALSTPCDPNLYQGSLQSTADGLTAEDLQRPEWSAL
jgi:Putative zinc-finger